MRKNRLIISDDEINSIRKKHNINEQNNKTLDFINKSFGDSSDNVFKKVLDSLLNKKSTSTSNPSEEPSSSVSSEYNDSLTKKGQELLETPAFKEKLSQISREINIDEESIIKLMNLESGLDPTIKNNIGCVGLIQFCPDKSRGAYKTIGGKPYSLEKLRNNLSLQMDAILEFWKEGYKSGKIKKPKDLYLYNFFPIAAGKPNNFVLQTRNLSAEKIAKQNPIFNRTLGKPSGSPLTVGDMEQYYRRTGMV
jgi:hypothetical protein